MSDNIIQFSNPRAEYEALQRCAVAFLDAFNALNDKIETLPESDAHRSHWDFLDWHHTCAYGPIEVARSIAFDREHAQWEWTVKYVDKRDRTRVLGTIKLADLTSAQASDMAERLAAGRGWHLERGKRITPLPDFAKHLAQAEDV